MTRTRKTTVQVIAVFVLVGLWQAEAWFGLVDRMVLPSALTVFERIIQETTRGDLLPQIWASMQRAYAGFAIGGSAGLLLGMAAGWNRTVASAIRTPLELIRPIPPLAWITLAIIWFGIDDGSKVFVIAMAAFFPVFTSAERGVRTIDPVLIRAATTLGRTRWRLVYEVVLPAAAPELATGIKVAWSWSFAALVASELLAAQSGLGFLINQGRINGDFSLIVASVLVIAMLALLSDQLFRAIALGRYLRWIAP